MLEIQQLSWFEQRVKGMSPWRWGRLLSSLDQFFKRSDNTEAAMQRLAETSPHLLVDLGFRRDPARSSDEQDVWVLEDREVVVLRRRQGRAGRG